MGAALYLLISTSSSASELEVTSGPGQAGPLSWEQARIVYRPDRVDEPGSWYLHASGLTWLGETDIGAIEIECRRGRMRHVGPECEAGRVRWTDGPVVASLEAGFRLVTDAEQFRISLTEGPVQGWVRLPRDGQGMTLAMQIETFPLADLPAELLGDDGLRDLEGHLSGSLDYIDERLHGVLHLAEVGFDSADGTIAGFAIDAQVEFDLAFPDGSLEFGLEIEQSAGELLVGPVYLPPPAEPLTVRIDGGRSGNGRMQIERLELNDPDALTVIGEVVLALGEEGWSLESTRLDTVQLQFPGAWERWLEGPLAAKGMAEMETVGRLNASLALEGGKASVDARLEDFYLDDPQGRFGLDQVNAELAMGDDRSSMTASWEAISLYGLPLSGSTLRLAGDGVQVGLVEPLIIPLLDGAVVVERLLWEYAEVGERELQLDARIDPLDLAELTELLGFPVFGGVLAGNFPGVRYADEVLEFTGGIDVQAFSGRIELKDLAVERPFGTLPALAAQVEFHRLDLAEVTGAFNFGHMEGQMSGWMHGLRLLDWRPVAMDARIFTHDDARRRRISQRAVENLSSLGGAGGALITGTVLRIFDEFPYRRAGLACRLSNNICHIDGVAQHESGGFYIIEGRSLPRLNIIGHRRLVDWPQLMSQLEAMMED